MKIAVNKLTKTADKYFYIVFGLWIYLTVFRFAELRNVMITDHIFLIISRLLSVLTFFNCVFKDNIFTYKRIIKIAIYLLLGIISLCTTGTIVFIDVFMVVMVAETIDYRRLVKAFFFPSILAYITIICFYYAGVIDTPPIILDNGMTRWILGFNGEPALAYVSFLITAFAILLLGTSRMYIDYLVTILSILFLAFIPKNKTAVMCVAVLLIYIFASSFYQKKSGKVIIENKIYCAVNWGIIISTYVITYLLTFIEKIRNPIEAVAISFYNRFYYGNIIMKTCGINLLGSRISFPITVKIGADELNCMPDNFYIMLPVKYGIVYFLFFTFMIFWSIRQYIRKKNNLMLIIMVCISIYSMMESVLIYLPFSFVFSLALTERNKADS